jgi:hypothetical protein
LIVQFPRSSKQPDVPGVETHGSVLVVLVLDVDVELLDVDVLELLVVLLEVVETMGGATWQRAPVQTGASPLPGSSVTVHVRDGSAQCENWISLRSHSGPASQRVDLGSTHRHPANTTSVPKKASID